MPQKSAQARTESSNIKGAAVISYIAEHIKELSVILGAALPVFVAIFCLIRGMKCLLRSEMLRTYYHNKDNETIRQYELENFLHLYNAYKALRGNSFIDKIRQEVLSWEVVS